MKVRDEEELWKARDMTELSAGLLQDNGDLFDCNPKCSREFGGNDRWLAVHFVKQVAEQVGRKGALTVSKVFQEQLGSEGRPPVVMPQLEVRNDGNGPIGPMSGIYRAYGGEE